MLGDWEGSNSDSQLCSKGIAATGERGCVSWETEVCRGERPRLKGRKGGWEIVIIILVL